MEKCRRRRWWETEAESPDERLEEAEGRCKKKERKGRIKREERKPRTRELWERKEDGYEDGDKNGDDKKERLQWRGKEERDEKSAGGKKRKRAITQTSLAWMLPTMLLVPGWVRVWEKLIVISPNAAKQYISSFNKTHLASARIIPRCSVVNVFWGTKIKRNLEKKKQFHTFCLFYSTQASPETLRLMEFFYSCCTHSIHALSTSQPLLAQYCQHDRQAPP